MVNILSATEMKQEFQTALAKGLPFPILTITEYLSQDGEGFCWGRSYRLAGYYANILLWWASLLFIARITIKLVITALRLLLFWVAVIDMHFSMQKICIKYAFIKYKLILLTENTTVFVCKNLLKPN